MIAVSKLCCPICWELLDVLRGNSEDFEVRGRHTTIYPVELPPWLPTEYMEQMVTRLRKYLTDELIIMMAQDADSEEAEASETHSRTPSLQSDSGYSTTSDDSILHVPKVVNWNSDGLPASV